MRQLTPSSSHLFARQHDLPGPLNLLRAGRSLSIGALDLLGAGTLNVSVSPVCYQPRPRSRYEGMEREQHTFLPGLPSIAPTVFSTTPLTLSSTVGVLLFLVVGAFFFSTRPAVVALARGLEVFAFAFGTVDFLEVDLGLGAESSMAKSTRGVLFFRSPGRLPSRTSFDFAIADGWEGRMKKMRSLGYELVEDW